MQWEHTFHAFTEGNLTHGERTGDARAVLACDADAFVILNPSTGAFGHFVTDADGVTRFEIGDRLPQRSNLLRFDLCDQVHDSLL